MHFANMVVDDSAWNSFGTLQVISSSFVFGIAETEFPASNAANHN